MNIRLILYMWNIFTRSRDMNIKLKWVIMFSMATIIHLIGWISLAFGFVIPSIILIILSVIIFLKIK
jgi:hypothetical protein